MYLLWWWNLAIWNFYYQVKLDLGGQGQSFPKTIEILTKVFCTSGPNRVISTYAGDELWCGQVQNLVNFEFQVKIWPWRSMSITPQHNKGLNQGVLHLFSKFGDPSLNGWWVIARTSTWFIHRQTDTQILHGRTDAGIDKNDNTRRTKLVSAKNSCKVACCMHV